MRDASLTPAVLTTRVCIYIPTDVVRRTLHDPWFAERLPLLDTLEPLRVGRRDVDDVGRGVVSSGGTA
jgi:hypothetical protein